MPSTVFAPLKGDKCFIKNGANKLESGIILDTRSSTTGKWANTEYYIHFEGKDRRFDVWLSGDKLQVPRAKRTGKNPTACIKKRVRKVKEISPVETADIIDYSPLLDKQHEEFTKVKYIETIRYSNYELDTWYFSPFPDEFGRQKHLFICHRCLKYIKDELVYRAHVHDCSPRSPPGREIYKENNFCVFEVDGDQQKLYCQCLCLLSKLFLDDKTIYFDTTDFLFYVLCEQTEEGYLPVGYFSKERTSPDDHNLNCILIFPPYQRKGYGKLLIQLSYELSRREGIVGSPEKPLSDLGLVSYRSFWAYLIVGHLMKMMDTSACTVVQLSREIGIHVQDIMTTLNWLNLIDSSVHSPSLHVRISFKELDQLWKTAARPPSLILNQRLLRWKPSNV